MTLEYQQAKSDYEKIRDSIILQRQQDQVAAGILRDINALKRGLQADPKPKVVTVKARPKQPKYVFPEPRRSKRDRKHHNYQELLDEDYPAPRTYHQAKRRKTSAAKATTEDPSQEDPKAAQVPPEAVPKATKGEVLEASPTPEYAKDLGIDVAKMDNFRGKEFHKTEGIPCPSCNTFFTTELALSQHKATTKVVDGSCQALTRGVKDIPCYRCPEVFPTKLGMLEHCTTAHILPFKPRPLGEKQCPWCLKHFVSRKHMLFHYGRKHCGHDRKDFKCDTCGREFVQKAHLTQHIKMVHHQERPHHCEECGKSFGIATDLRRHVDRVHLHLKPFVCGWEGCTMAFATTYQRRDHQRNSHNGEWRYGCQVCEDHDGTWRGFNNQWHLDKHMEGAHPEEWQLQQEAYVASHPHQCNKNGCGKRFETMEELLRHKAKIHGC